MSYLPSSRLVLIDDDTEAGLQQHADRQDQEPQLAPLFAGHVKQVDADHRRLIGRCREVAHRRASVLAIGRLFGAEFGPLRLGRHQIDFRGRSRLALRGLTWRRGRSWNGGLGRRLLRKCSANERDAHCEGRCARARDLESHQSSSRTVKRNRLALRPFARTPPIGARNWRRRASGRPHDARRGDRAADRRPSFHIRRDIPIAISSFRPRAAGNSGQQGESGERRAFHSESADPR